MKELKIKDIIGYVPHGLCVAKDDNVIKVIDINIVYPPYSGFAYIYKDDVYRYHLYVDSGYKPVLRPLSDLYRVIRHNGKKVIPIVECAKIASPNLAWELSSNEAELTIRNKHLYFGYVEGSFYTNYKVINHYLLFDYLHELKIDYRGLIDAGLAIDYNTLKNNL